MERHKFMIRHLRVVAGQLNRVDSFRQGDVQRVNTQTVSRE
jgi:hypothetical protein